MCPPPTWFSTPWPVPGKTPAMTLPFRDNHSPGGIPEIGDTSPLRDILDPVVAGGRLAFADAVRLLESRQLASIGHAADAVTRRLHPEPFRTYNIDRNINYTNICTAVCDFCAFYRGPKSPEGYVLDRDVLLKKIEETVALGGDQILMQGGLHPTLPL